MPDAPRRTGILCRLCQTRRILRRGLESDSPICICVGPRRNERAVLLRRLDKQTRHCHLCSCNDGLRPVIFKQEVTNEESQINYIPVQD